MPSSMYLSEMIPGVSLPNGTEDEPAAGSQRGRDELKDYQKRASKAVAFIYGSVTPAIQSYITSITNPREMEM